MSKISLHLVLAEVCPACVCMWMCAHVCGVCVWCAWCVTCVHMCGVCVVCVCVYICAVCACVRARVFPGLFPGGREPGWQRPGAAAGPSSPQRGGGVCRRVQACLQLARQCGWRAPAPAPRDEALLAAPGHPVEDVSLLHAAHSPILGLRQVSAYQAVHSVVIFRE